MRSGLVVVARGETLAALVDVLERGRDDLGLVRVERALEPVVELEVVDLLDLVGRADAAASV